MFVCAARRHTAMRSVGHGKCGTCIRKLFGRSRLPCLSTSTFKLKLHRSREVHAFFHSNENSSSFVHIQPPTTTDIALTAPPPDRIIQASPTIPPHSESAPGLDSDEGEEETVIPVILSIPNVCFWCFSRPVLTWWHRNLLNCLRY